MTTADRLLPPPSLSRTKLPIPLSPHKIINPSTHEILPLSSMFFQLSHQTCCLFSFHVYRIRMHTHLTYITCLRISHKPNFFLSLSLSVSLGLYPTLSSTYIQSFPPYLLHLQKLSLHVSFTHWICQNVASIMDDVELWLFLLHPTK